MRLDQLVRRNLSRHRVSSGLTALNVALGALVVSVVLVLRAATANAFLQPSRGFALVVGAPGSRLELVLDTVFHLGQSPGLLDFGVLDELERNGSTQLAVPYAVGDTFRGYRVVGTTEAFFDPRFPYPQADSPAGKLASGRPLASDRAALNAALGALVGETRSPRRVSPNVEEVPSAERPIGPGSTRPSPAQRGRGEPGTNLGHEVLVNPPRTAPPPVGAAGGARNEAVVGAEVAAALDVRVGDHIEPTHGLEAKGAAHRGGQLWDVVGVLSRTGTPIDRLVLINLDSFFRIPDHAGGVIPETGRPGISAVLLFPKPGVHKALLLSQLNKRNTLEVADIDAEVHALLALVGNVDRVFFAIAILVVLVGIVSVSVAIYNTLAARRREFAILRILGASRRTVFAILVGEAGLLSAVGGLLGMCAGHAVVAATASVIERSAGFHPSALVLLPEEGVAYLLILAAGALGGLLPAFQAYRSDVATNLAPAP